MSLRSAQRQVKFYTYTLYTSIPKNLCTLSELCNKIENLNSLLPPEGFHLLFDCLDLFDISPSLSGKVALGFNL